MLAVFLAPTGQVLRAAGVVLAAVRRITGVGLIADLTMFLRLLSGLLDGLRGRAADVARLLSDEQTAFLIVISPESAPLEEAIFFARELERRGMHRAGVVVNRVHPPDGADPHPRSAARRLAPVLGASLASSVARAHADVALLARRDQAALAALRAALDEPAPVCACSIERGSCTTSRNCRQSCFGRA